MTAATSKGDDDAEIRALIERRAQAVRAKDLEALVSNVAPGIRWFDLADPLQYVGSDAVRKRAEKWFSTFETEIGYELSDVTIAAGADAAFSHCLTRVSGTTRRWRVDMWLRTTVCYRKIGGKWTVVHEHNSIPFDMDSGRASLGLKP